jgi:hypothetical protein
MATKGLVKCCICCALVVSLFACKQRNTISAKKGHYVNKISVSNNAAIINLGDTLKFSFVVPSPLVTSTGETIAYQHIDYSNSFILSKYDYSGTLSGTGDKRFYPYDGFVYGHYDGTKNRSRFSFDKGNYTDYFVAKDTGVYYVTFIPQLSNIFMRVSKRDVLATLCYNEFSPSNKHRELAESLIPDYITYFNHLDSVGAGYYCWRVVP